MLSQAPQASPISGLEGDFKSTMLTQHARGEFMYPPL